MGRFSPTVQEQRFSPLAEALSQGTRNFLTFFDAARRRKMEDEDRRRMDEARQYEMSQRPLREALMEAQLREQGIRPAAEAADTTFQVPTLGAGGFEAGPAPATLAKELRFRPLGESGRVLDTLQTPTATRRNERAESQRLANALFERQQEAARQAGDLQFTRQKELAGVQAENARELERARAASAMQLERLRQEGAAALAGQRADAAGVKPPLSGEARGRTMLALPRMEESNAVLDRFAAPPARTLLSKVTLGNYGLSPQEQVFQNAAENFVNGVLRTESGATVTEEEREAAIRALVPQPGDKPEVVEQKRLMRQRVLETFRSGVGQPEPIAEPRQYSPDNPFAPR